MKRFATALAGLCMLWAAACGDDSSPCKGAACAPDSGGGGDDGGAGHDDARTDRCTATTCGGVEPICDTGSGQCRACQTGPECLAKDPSRPVCVIARCVECASSSDCTNPTRPFCDVTLPNHCRSCARDSECGAGGICDETFGTCVAPADTIYVSKTGAASGTCGTQAAPCATVGQALPQVLGARKWVLVGPGSYAEPLSVVSQTMNLVGPGAILAGDGSGPAITIGAGANVTLEGFVVTGSNPGVVCNAPPTNLGTLILRGVIVEQNATLGVQATSCVVALDRAIVRHNAGGGLQLSSSRYDIVNSFITDNGSGTATIGGVRIDGTLPVGMSRLAFTTIANNQTLSAPSGVMCATTAAAPTIQSSIVYGNGTMGGGTGCSFANCDVQGGTFNANPMFVSAAAGDYHLMATSPCKDMGDNLGAPSFDFDGDPRPLPLGGTVDIGADEITP